MNDEPWNDNDFTARLREVGALVYHDKHPFHQRMNSGELDRPALQAWVANRFYYQLNIPIKDAALMSNCPIREVRRLWLHRIVDHDGTQGDEGGIGAWLRLGTACGLDRAEMLSSRHVLPAVRFAVDAYVNFARTQPWPIAIASSLTELFAPDLMAQRLQAFEKFYDWIEPRGLEYFRNRLTQARRDSGEALQLTLRYCTTRASQETAVRALQFKCDLLWAMLDAIQLGTLRAARP
jgi:pyrroloquinoline-quinone synthase